MYFIACVYSYWAVQRHLIKAVRVDVNSTKELPSSLLFVRFTAVVFVFDMST